MAADMKETIAQAAKTLLMEKGVKKLTVTDIVEECRITRQAFYYHFEDIPGLFRWMLERDAEQTKRQAQAIEDGLFQHAPVSRQYPKEMYYRLLAPLLLPGEVRRVLYLDPDILVINPIRPLWETDLRGNLFAAAAHTGKTELASGVNQLRLGTEGDYYNSGVLLMDLEAGRTAVNPQALFSYVERHRKELLLPDQDVLNALYSRRILPLEDVIWNYDARGYSTYLLRSGGVCDVPWVMAHTAILHFCGKEKPWKPNYHRRFGILYQHYVQLTRREAGSEPALR